MIPRHTTTSGDSWPVVAGGGEGTDGGTGFGWGFFFCNDQHLRLMYDLQSSVGRGEGTEEEEEKKKKKKKKKKGEKKTKKKKNGCDLAGS